MSAETRRLDIPRLCEDLNILAIIPKPFSPAELVQTIASRVAKLNFSPPTWRSVQNRP